MENSPGARQWTLEDGQECMVEKQYEIMSQKKGNVRTNKGLQSCFPENGLNQGCVHLPEVELFDLMGIIQSGLDSPEGTVTDDYPKVVCTPQVSEKADNCKVFMNNDIPKSLQNFLSGIYN